MGVGYVADVAEEAIASLSCGYVEDVWLEIHVVVSWIVIVIVVVAVAVAVGMVGSGEGLFVIGFGFKRGGCSSETCIEIVLFGSFFIREGVHLLVFVERRSVNASKRLTETCVWTDDDGRRRKNRRLVYWRIGFVVPMSRRISTSTITRSK